MVYNIFNVTFEYSPLNPCIIFVLYQFCVLSVLWLTAHPPVILIKFGCTEYISVYAEIIYLMMLSVAQYTLLNDRVISE